MARTKQTARRPDDVTLKPFWTSFGWVASTHAVCTDDKAVTASDFHTTPERGHSRTAVSFRPKQARRPKKKAVRRVSAWTEHAEETRRQGQNAQRVAFEQTESREVRARKRRTAA